MNLQKIKALLEFVANSRVSELTVSQDGTTVVIRNAASGQAVAEPSVPAAEPVADRPEGAAESGGGLLRSPVSGVVHRSGSPGAGPLAKPGDMVAAGQGLCIVEAMKVFTTVPSPVAGKVLRILFEDGQEVAAGQPLVEIG